MPSGRIDLNLPDVSVAPILVVGKHSNLNEMSAEHTALRTVIRCRVTRGAQDADPSTWLGKHLGVYVSEIVERAADTNCNARRRIALVELEVSVDLDFMNAHLLVELDVD